MMRFTGALGACLAALSIVPATLGEGDSGSELGSIESALSRTVHALELLAGIRAQETPAAMTLVREVTETPLPAGPEREEKLELLRTQVSLLQQQLDIVEQRFLEGADSPSDPARPAGPVLAPPEGVTKGLDADLLAALSRVGVPRPPEAQTQDAPELAEHPTYSADPLLHAQACYRAGRYERGQALLEADETTAGLYWRARCLEKLDRLAEAAALYTAVLERADAGSLADRARTNLEFVEWKLQFMAQLPVELRSRKETVAR